MQATATPLTPPAVATAARGATPYHVCALFPCDVGATNTTKGTLWDTLGVLVAKPPARRMRPLYCHAHMCSVHCHQRRRARRLRSCLMCVLSAQI